MLDSSSNVTLWTNIFRETESLVNPFFFCLKKTTSGVAVLCLMLKCPTATNAP